MAGIVALRPHPPSTPRAGRWDATAEGGAALAEDAALAPVRPLRLAEIRATGLVRQASERVPSGGVERFLPVGAGLRPLFPGGSLRRGSTVAVGRDGAAPGSTSLLFALLAAASAAGSWCAGVGLPHLGLVAAAEAGVVVDRLALVPNPGPEWPSVVAALLDGVDIVVTATSGPVAATVASRLAARARQRGGVLVPVGRWTGTDLILEVVGGAWHGLGEGRGRLRRREVEVLAHGRGAAARARRARLWLPGSMVDGSMVDGSIADGVVSARPAESWVELAAPVPLELAG